MASSGGDRFLNGFCSPDMTLADFRNALGKFTPCFTDVCVLGTAEAFAIAVFVAQLARTYSGCAVVRHRLTGLAASVHVFSAVLAAAGVLIPLLLLNARLGEGTATDGAAAGLPLAPYEWMGFGLSMGRWGALMALLLRELQGGGHVILPGRWLVRFALVLGASAEVVKARFLLWGQQDPEQPLQMGYFFFLYATYLGVQLLLAALALTWRPSRKQGLLRAEEQEYLLLASSDETADPRVGRNVPCPEATIGLWSYFTFAWMSPLIQKGYRSPLTTDDIWSLPPGDRTNHLDARFEKLWREEVSQRGPKAASLGAVCWRLTSELILWAVPYKVLNDAAQFVGPVFLKMLLQTLSEGGPAWRGYMAACLMFAGAAVGVLADNQHFQRVMRAGFQLKAVLSAAVHRQIFLLTPGARGAFSSGRVYSLAASDVEAIQALMQNVMGFISSPLRILVAVVLLYRELGPASLTAVLVLVALVPANAVLVAASNKALKAALGHTDERTKLEAEMMAGIMVVKCSAWEEPLQDRIETARRRELAQLWRVNVLSSIVTTLLLAVPVLIPVITFGAYLALGNQLDAAKAFTCMVLFNVLRFPLFLLPQLVAQFSAAKVSTGRLRDFLAAEAADPPAPLPAAEPGATAVRLVGDFGWDSRRPPTLVNLDLDARAGQLVAIVGSTGSGKSTFISAVLGQAQQLCGPRPRLAGRLGYVPQSPFIVNATVRDNILFGLPYDEARYQAALEGSCLRDDLQQLPGGDLTEMGDRGVNVSGGQKQRIALARALYADPDVVLLDDPLSALDAAVGRMVFEEGIVKGLLSSGRRTVLMATNQLHFVRRADLVVVLERHGGRVAEVGPPLELMAANGAFAALMRQEVLAEEEAKEQAGGGETGKPGEGDADGQADLSVALAAPAPPAPPAGGGAAQAHAGRITQDEGAAEGALSANTLLSYLGAMPMPGGAVAAGLWLVGGFSAAEALRMATTVWLAQWTETRAEQPGGHGTMWYLGVYAAISGVQLLVQAGSTLESNRLGLGAAQKLHSRLLSKLLGAPLAFFHSTPLGRIVNRLTKDTGDIDRNLASVASMATRTGLQLASTLALVAAVAPFALPALVVIMLAFYWLYQYFQASVRQVKRLDSVARSPVMSSLTEALNGTATYVAYRAQGRAASRHAELLDRVSVMALVNQSMNRWLSVRLEVLGAAAALLSGLVAVEQRSSAGSAGLVMTYALQVTVAVSITIRTASMAETMLNSVERVIEYCGLEQEGEQAAAKGGPSPPGALPSSSGPLALPPVWPSAGEVEFVDVQLRYRPGLPLVLLGVSFKTEAREKIGVVGRTGAGKSSLLGCLFRLVEVERGAVLIDGLDISRLPLRELRGRLGLIPQSPVLFTGPIRDNLSPFGRHSDGELWGALRRAHLAQLVESWPAGLDTELAEGGAPLSAGQKQLLALARALLNPAKVLVLDEATANVDVETDALIQSTLRSEFPDRTLLAIAHRLATIIDYNRILLLDAGRVIEYDTPSALLARPGSSFGRLVDETGEASARVLRQLASGGGNMVQDMLAAPALAALERMRSSTSRQPSSVLSPAPSFVRQASLGAALLRGLSKRGFGGQHLLGRRALPEGEGEGDWRCEGEGEPLLAEYDTGGVPLRHLAAMVASRSCAVARLVKELRAELDQHQDLQVLAATGGIGATVGDMGMMMLAGAAGGGGGGGGGDGDGDGGAIDEGGGSRREAEVAGAAAARLVMARCLTLLEEAQAGALALHRAWTASGLGGEGPEAIDGAGDDAGGAGHGRALLQGLESP